MLKNVEYSKKDLLVLFMSTRQHLHVSSLFHDLFAKYKMSWKQVRGQGYNGASNMRGEFNGVRALIMRE
jgi:hypothetical protein